MRVAGKEFWIWDITQHKLEYRRTNGDCCFNHIIALPEKDGKQMPMFPYEQQIYKTLFEVRNHFSDRHLWIKKATGLGITEFFLRLIAWLALRNDDYKGTDVCILTGPSIDLAIKLVKRVKNLFTPHNIYFEEFAKDVLYLNGVRIQCYPSHHLSSYRSLVSPTFILLDEADFFPVGQQSEARDVSERYIAKSDPYIVMISTPNAPGQLFDKIEQEDETTCIYKRIKLDYTVGLGKIYTEEEIQKAKASPSFDREYNLKYLGRQGTTFRTADIEIAQSFTYDPDLIPTGNSRVIGIDPAWGSSTTGIVVTEFRDGRVAVLYAEEFPHATSENMIDLVCDLYHKYYPIYRINVDSSQISFIKSLKQALMSELREDVDYERQIKMFTDNHCDWRNNLQLQPVYFNTKNNQNMLSHTRTFLENGWLAIDKRFTKLIISLHTATDTDGKLDKQAMSLLTYRFMLITAPARRAVIFEIINPRTASSGR
jgi:hypothetical protein